MKRKRAETENNKNDAKATSIVPILASDIVPKHCTTPKFKMDQCVIDASGYHALRESSGAIVVARNVLSSQDRQTYIDAAVQQIRVIGPSGFSMKPRAEVCYTTTGEAFHYSGHRHFTTPYPPHVLAILPQLLATTEAYLPKHVHNPYTVVSNAADIVYNSRFDRGGSVSAHQDNEMAWGLVIIYSLGQSRWLRIRHTSGRFYNVKMVDNSVVAMVGRVLQQEYTHQVDKLSAKEEVGTRLSLNIRYLARAEQSKNIF